MGDALSSVLSRRLLNSVSETSDCLRFKEGGPTSREDIVGCGRRSGDSGMTMAEATTLVPCQQDLKSAESRIRLTVLPPSLWKAITVGSW